VIGSLLNLLFRCPHRRLTYPLAPLTNVGKQHSQGYVVCLDCGKPFEYDMERMRIGKLIVGFPDVHAVPKNMKSPLATKVKYAVVAAVPVALVIGAVLKAKKARPKKDVGTEEGGAPKGAEGFSATDRPGGLSH
jgi:hypothetical protein